MERPYAEWYYNTMRIPGSPTEAYHREHYGANFNYYDFAPIFDRETKKWDPAVMAAAFQDAGARYVVLTSKHHEGFTLWPSKVVNPNQQHLQAERDIVGELTEAVRKDDMKMGFLLLRRLRLDLQPRPHHRRQRLGDRQARNHRIRTIRLRPDRRTDCEVSSGGAVERYRLAEDGQGA